MYFTCDFGVHAFLGFSDARASISKSAFASSAGSYHDSNTSPALLRRSTFTRLGAGRVGGCCTKAVSTVAVVNTQCHLFSPVMSPPTKGDVFVHIQHLLLAQPPGLDQLVDVPLQLVPADPNDGHGACLP